MQPPVCLQVSTERFPPLQRQRKHVLFRTRAALAVALAFGFAVQVSANARAQATAADKEQCLSTHERAQVDRLQGRLLDARAGLLVCAQRGCPRLVSKDCTVWLSEVDASLPTVVFSAVDASGAELREVRVSAGERVLTNHLDGQPLMLDPGPYALRFEAQGFDPLTQQVTIHEGEKGRVLRVTLRPSGEANPAVATSDAAQEAAPVPVQSSHKPTNRLLITSIALMAVGAAGGAVALGTGLAGHKKLLYCDENDCSDAELERGQRLYRTVNYAGGIGGAAFLAGAAMLWPALRKRSTGEQRDSKVRSSTLVHPYASVDGGGAVVGGSW